MKSKIIIGCLISIFLLLIVPSIPAIEHKTMIEQQTAERITTFTQIKEKLEHLGCPASITLILIYLAYYVAICFERITIGSTSPILFSLSTLFTFHMMMVAVYYMAASNGIDTPPPIYSIANMENLTTEDFIALMKVIFLVVFVKSIRISLVNRFIS